ncbi:SIR2-like domain-containing protein [Sphingomonas sp. NFR04]|uniref:SIR2 family protein n=1 Tax=Sphingomonas sp. NFR04 TaxID=1566283 RepID=UPI0008E2C99A|nr:SIR2 family protein [Sphingomonas sp. NFR04]SFK15986.1 SIR2-like domain-containing protein [Sphingomonas sp. NFR04]
MSSDHTFISNVCEAVVSGGAVCLLGAGFATAGKDHNGKDVPSTSELIVEIKNAIGLQGEPVNNLADIADYCEDRADLNLELRKLLLSRLTLCQPSDQQVSVVRQPWRSIFTTNFDDVIETSLPSSARQVITPTSHSLERSVDLLPIYYMHGRARDMLERTVDPRLVLSERNYLRLHEDNRELYAQLQNELFAAKYIVIIGYSLRDLEVARIFIEAGHAFRDKTLIITGEQETEFSQARLQKFGEVHAIGMAGFSAAVSAAKQNSTGDEHYNFIEIIENTPPANEIDADDFVRLIITGRFESAFYQRQLIEGSMNGELYSIRRPKAIDTIVKRPKSGVNRFMITSDLGNGKSVFIQQLGVELLSSGYTVVEVSSGLQEAFGELDRLLASGQPVAYLIDDVIRHRIAAEYIGKRLNAISIIVCCMRGDPGEVAYRELCNRLGGASQQIDLNKLTIEEIDQWDSSLERWGLWEERIALSHEDRIKFLTKDCASENRSIILALFRSSRIAEKINQIVTFFLKDGGYQRTFAALLISALCQQHVSWESLVAWLDIDENRLRVDLKESELAELFFDGREWHIITSTQLADYILRTKYVSDDRDTLVDVYSTIVQRTAQGAGDDRLGYIFRENLKELMKFRFLTRLFGDNEDGIRLISRVYKRLAKAQFIRNNPQFWLQYAMSRMQVDDLDNAETYLNTALGCAAERGLTYSPFQILDQRARLFFRKNSKAKAHISLNEIRQAVNDLGSLLGNPESEIIYLYRSAPLIEAFLEEKIDELDDGVRADLRGLLERIKDAGEGLQRLPRAQKGETPVLKKALANALITLNFA